MISGEAGSPVFCIIIKLSIHVALIYQALEVLHKHFISYSHGGTWEGGGSRTLEGEGGGEANPRTFSLYKWAHSIAPLLASCWLGVQPT